MVMSKLNCFSKEFWEAFNFLNKDFQHVLNKRKIAFQDISIFERSLQGTKKVAHLVVVPVCSIQAFNTAACGGWKKVNDAKGWFHKKCNGKSSHGSFTHHNGSKSLVLGWMLGNKNIAQMGYGRAIETAAQFWPGAKIMPMLSHNKKWEIIQSWTKMVPSFHSKWRINGKGGRSDGFLWLADSGWKCI